MKAEWTNKDSLSIESTGQKAILVIDNPDSCAECPLMASDFDGYTICVGNGERFAETDPFYNCQLRPLPQKKEVNLPNDRVWSKDEIMAYTHGISVGYNECLDDLGETE